MRAMKRNLKLGVRLIFFLFLFQSCTVYYGYTSSAEEAVTTSKKVKIKIPGEDSYVYKRLKRIDYRIYGITRPKSGTARRMQSQVVNNAYEGKYALVELSNDELDHIHIMNEQATWATTIALDVTLFLLLMIPLF